MSKKLKSASLKIDETSYFSPYINKSYQLVKSDSQLCPLDQLISDTQSLTPNTEFIEQIEKAVKLKKDLMIKRFDKEDLLSIKALKLIQINFEDVLIGVDHFNYCFTSLYLADIESFKFSDISYLNETSEYEVEEFVQGILMMTHEDTRLVLKVLRGSIEQKDWKHPFMSKSYFVTNPKGEVIWSAYVQESEELFEWLLRKQPDIEILESVHLKEKFLKYCEDKLKKIA